MYKKENIRSCDCYAAICIPGEQKKETNSYVSATKLYPGIFNIYAEAGPGCQLIISFASTSIYNQTGMQGSPLIDDSTLYFGCRDSHLYSLNALTGTLYWKKFNDYAWVSSCPVIEKEKIIYTTGDSHLLIALNKYNGDSLYTFSTKGWIMSSPSVAGGNVYYGDLNGFVYANDIATGKLRWMIQTDGSKTDKYKIIKKDSTLDFIVFSKEKKMKEGTTSMQMLCHLGSVHSSPVLKDGVIYFGATDGYFYAMQ